MNDRRYMDGKTLKDVLLELVNHYRCNDHLTESKIVGMWEDVVGRMIATHTITLFFKNGILTVRLDSSIIRQELSYNKHSLIEKINKLAGDTVVKDIVLS